VAAENSMGFHAPQEMARILGEVIYHARLGQLEAETAARRKVDASRLDPVQADADAGGTGRGRRRARRVAPVGLVEVRVRASGSPAAP